MDNSCLLLCQHSHGQHVLQVGRLPHPHIVSAKPFLKLLRKLRYFQLGSFAPPAQAANMCTPVTSGLLKSYMSSSPWSNKAWASGELVWILRMAAGDMQLAGMHVGGGAALQLHRPLHARWASRMVWLLLLATVSAVCSPFCCAEVDVLSMELAACHQWSQNGMPQSCIGTIDAAGFSVHGSLTCW
jgi:hypothetical protein